MPFNAKILIDIKDISVSYRKIIENLEFTRNSPGIISLQGSTGSGKSTLLKSIAGIIPGIYSSFKINGKIRLCNATPMEALIDGKVAYIPQDPSNFFIGVKVKQELDLLGEINKFFTDLFDYRKMYIDRLSDGLRYKLLTTVAFNNDTRIILLDEPSSHLDPWVLKDFLQLLKEYSFEKDAIVFIAEHRRKMIEGYIDETIILTEYMNQHNFLGNKLKINTPSLSTFFHDSYVNVSDLKLSFNGRTILKNIGFKIENGTTVAIVGRNGEGKTTLLKCLAGIYECKGNISVKSHLYYIPQSPVHWFSQATVEKEILFQSKIKHLKELKQTTRLFMLDKKLKDNPFNLSTGEARRLSLLKAFLSRADIILLDEPTMGLDQPSKIILDNLIRDFKERGGIVIAAMHDHEFARKFDMVYKLEKGELYETRKSELLA